MKLLTLGEASRRSGIGARILKRAVADGRLPARRVDGWTYQIEPDDLASFSLACQVEELSAAAGQRAIRADRQRAVAPPAASPTRLARWFRTLVANVRPALVPPLR